MLQANMLAINKELPTNTWKQCLFLYFDNMNFYKHRQDQRLHNKDNQIAYTVGYVCFMHFKGDNEVDGN